MRTTQATVKDGQKGWKYIFHHISYQTVGGGWWVVGGWVDGSVRRVYGTIIGSMKWYS